MTNGRPAAGRRRLLVLGDRYETMQHLANRGDAAMQDGLRTLLSDRPGLEAVPGPWKSFPRLRETHLAPHAGVDSIRGRLDTLASRAMAYPPRRARVETRVTRILDSSPLLNNPIRRAIDRRFIERYSRDAATALIPLLLRHHTTARLVEAIRASDAVMANGDGLIADHQGSFLPGFVLEGHLAAALGKPVAVINQTVDLSHPNLRAIVEAGYRSVPVHSTRDDGSAEALVELGVDPGAIIASADIAFAISPAAIPDMSDAAHREGIDRRTVLFTARGDRAGGTAVGAWSDLIRFVRDRLGYGVKMLYTAPDGDSEAAKDLNRLCGVGSLGTYGHGEIIGLAQHAAALVTDRYHASIFGLIAGAAVVPISSNTEKVRRLFDMIGYPIRAQPSLSAASVRSTCETVAGALADPQRLRAAAAATRKTQSTRVRADMDAVLQRLGVVQ